MFIFSVTLVILFIAIFELDWTMYGKFINGIVLLEKNNV